MKGGIQGGIEEEGAIREKEVKKIKKRKKGEVSRDSREEMREE
jgi:hypothetical protein